MGTTNESKTCSFTQAELYILSDGLLALIDNNNKAMMLIQEPRAVEELKNASKKYQALNAKVCSLMQ